jgi:undecaprenol kinase
MSKTTDSRNNSRTHELLRSLAAAWTGLASAVRTQRNVRVHLIAALTVLAIGIVFQISTSEWCTLAITIAGVVSLELMNTALETAVNLVTLEAHPLARTAKDTAAAAVLVMAMASVIIGLVIFLPRVLHVVGE